MEVWKDIPDYEGYQVSNTGKVRTYNKTTYTKKHGIRKWKNRILKPKEKVPKKYSKHQGLQGKGYAVDLWKNGKPKTMLIARLVAFTFYNKDINNKNLTVDHIDGNRLNNSIENLEIVSLKENIRRGYANGLYTRQKNVEIKNKKNGKTLVFRNMIEASVYIGHSKSYISNCIYRNKFNNEQYQWALV